MEDPSKVYLRVEIHFRGKTVIRAVELGPAYQSEIMSSPPSLLELDTMETAVVKMKTRDYSRETIQTALQKLGHQISNELEDAYGWHGADREEAARSRIGLPPSRRMPWLE